MSDSFIEGDIVKLKSGGPEMHVLDIKRVGPKEFIYCFWFKTPFEKVPYYAPPETLFLVSKSVITPTQKLFRAVTKKDDVAKSHQEGKLWFRSHQWFQNKEGEDNTEGDGCYKVQGRNAACNDVLVKCGFPIFFMSFSETVEGARSFDRGSDSHTLLEVQNPIKLRDEVIKKLPNSKYIKVRWHKMEYGKIYEVPNDLGPGENFNRKYYQKPEKYRIESEWRLEIEFIYNSRKISKTQRHRWGKDIGNLFEISSEK